MDDVFDGIVGHEPQIAYLRTVMSKKNQSHAYCFAGATSLGKGLIAERFAAGLLNVSPERVRAHPDVTVVDLPVDEKTQQKKSSIPVESIRQLRDHLQLSSFANGARIALIHHADTMTIAAQNALLKTLEEPRANTVIILIAESPDRLLSTIRSRSVQLRFQRIPREVICSHLREEGLSQDEAHEVAGLAAGRPGVAVELLDKEIRSEHAQQMELIDAFLSAPLAQQISELEKLVKNSSRSELEKQLDRMQLALHDQFLHANGCAGWAARQNALGADPGVRTLKAVVEARRALRQNISQNLIFENIILRLYENA